MRRRQHGSSVSASGRRGAEMVARPRAATKRRPAHSVCGSVGVAARPTPRASGGRGGGREAPPAPGAAPREGRARTAVRRGAAGRGGVNVFRTVWGAGWARDHVAIKRCGTVSRHHSPHRTPHVTRHPFQIFCNDHTAPAERIPIAPTVCFTPLPQLEPSTCIPAFCRSW